jgi:hypothetical protein
MIIGYVNNIPVFKTKSKALLWAKKYGLNGYHEHVVNRLTGYMGGDTHTESIIAFQGPIAIQPQINTTESYGMTKQSPPPPPSQPVEQQQTVQQSPPPPPSQSSGGGY